MSLEDDLRAQLSEFGVRPVEKLGQHFLIDEGVIQALGGVVISGAHVVEVGAGTGNVTRELAKRASSVIAVEVDDRYRQILNGVEKEHPNVSIYYGNVLDKGLGSLMVDGEYNQVIGNLPFHITEPFLGEMIGLPMVNGVLLVGDNVASEFFEDENSWGFGRMSLLVQTFFDVNKLYSVSRRSSYPSPRTDSTIVEFVPKDMQEISSDPSKYVFAKLFTTASSHGLVVNVIKDALVEVSERLARGTLDKSESWQRVRSSFRKQAKLWISQYESTGNISVDDEGIEKGGVITQDQALRKIDRMRINNGVLHSPFLRLDNRDIRDLVKGVRSVF